MSYKDNLTLTVYWPPTKDYVNDTQYRYLAEAGINHVLGAGEETLHTPDIQKKMLGLCEKYGMTMTLHDGDFGPALLGKSEGEIAACVRKYKDEPACDGFYLQDEPFNPNIYTDAACAIKKVWADASLHLNFLPRFSYDSDAAYVNQMNDWCAVCRANGFDVDFLTYDFYPFGFGEGNMNREGFYKNLSLCHKVARHNGVRAGIYLQSVSLLDGYPTPGENELRYEINLALAYGFKWLSYFTWFTPINRPGEQFADGIMTEHGEPTPLYETVKKLNRQVLNVGVTLVNCEATEIYCNGGRYGVSGIPDGFFVRAIDDGDYMLSHLVDPTDGRHYIMTVNNDFLNPRTVNLKFDRSVSELAVLSYDDGKMHPIQSNVGAVSLDLFPGGAAIIVLPEGYEPIRYDTGSKNADLCLDAKICCTNSAGECGYYISALNDGKRKPTEAIGGWRTYRGKNEADIIIEFADEKTLNKIDLYKYSDPEFPSRIEVCSSPDGVHYTRVCEINGANVSGRTAYGIEFEKIQARYIKLHVSDSMLGSIALCEIEVFNETDTEHKIPTCTELYGSDSVVNYTEGEDIARGKAVFASSFVPDSYRPWGWAKDFINDGKPDTGFSSAVGLHNSAEAAEFAVIDLGDMFCINSIALTAKGCFPHDYRIQISDDCTDWYDAVEMFDVRAEDGQRFEYPIEDIEGRYVRIFATELAASERDGYLLQLGGVEVYGVPVCDRTVLLATLDEYAESGADIGSEAYRRAYEYAHAKYLTQSKADACVQVLSMLYKLGPIEFTSDQTVHTPRVTKSKKPAGKVQKKAIFAAMAGAVVTAMAVATVVLVNNNTKNKKKK